MPGIHSILKEYWGYNSFRPLQEDIINSVLSGSDTLALLPTGGGKSICFQVPAMAKEGLCLVISPLIALMKDQVETLRRKNITAFAIYAGMTRKEVIKILQIAGERNCKFLYVSPERLETRLFLEYLPGLDVNLIAVDEAHCISQWGHDFRPPYLRIAALRDELPGVPVLALTASATPKVQVEIMDKLNFPKHKIFRQSFSRPNLSYSVFNVDTRIVKLVEILNNVPGSSIVYCRSRKRTKDTAEQLVSYNINADFYHAGLSSEERSAKQEAWISNKTRTIVCTNAFGMGIDKPDVRLVVHLDSPDSLENYYQEAGRAGRDQKKAYAVLLYQDNDITQLKEQPNLRFPDIAQIRIVYQAIMNFLQVPSGLGEGNYYDFDLQDFVTRFRLDTLFAINSLKVLEQQGLMSFNEQVFLPSKAEFICNRETLHEFEKNSPALDNIIKILLRNYEGVFDRAVIINEKSIAWMAKKEVEEIRQSLHQLHRYGVIDYQPQKDKPQLFFVQNRIKAEDLRIDAKQYQIRKEDYTNRINSFINYIGSGTCRSKTIGTYFGDDQLADCGVCDNCLIRKRSDLSQAEFDSIARIILSTVDISPLSSKSLLDQLQHIEKEKAWKVISFLQAENKITLNDTGMITRSR